MWIRCYKNRRYNPIYYSFFFEKYYIEGSKYKNYIYFKEAAYIIKNKQHLNKVGMGKIIKLKNLMNKNE